VRGLRLFNERLNIRSTGKVFGGKQLVSLGFESVGHDCGR